MDAAFRQTSEQSALRARLDGRVAVSPNEAAAMLGLHLMTVYRLIWSKALPAKKLGKSWLIAVSTLEQILTDASDSQSR